ncbi:MAG: ATP phosphoribosyltransferase regulatory subunit [Succiniclasticum sp.]|jgi:ATP phosphoribosyltransferase regulatory subunit
MTDSILRVPYGTRDILPGEGALRRQLEQRIGRLFASWGYDEVDTPTFEYVDTFAATGDLDRSAFRFLDRNGRALMLRTDMTAPIARMVATRFRHHKGVKRLSYRSHLFRYEEAQAGRQCEFSQCGIEMMGAAGAEADAEVIALAVQTLLDAGLRDFTISLGQMEFIHGLLEAAALSDGEARAVKQCLAKRDVVGLGKVVDAAGVPTQLAAVFKDLLYLHGGVDLLQELQDRVLSRRCWDALENLRRIYHLCDAYGVASYLSFDLGLTRSLDYYTGMLFEGYAAGMGYSIIGGGRYDKLMQQFGTPCPATGFAVGMERLVLTLQRQQGLEQADLPVPPSLFLAYAPEQTEAAIRLAGELRRQGQRVKLATWPMTEEEAAAQAKANQCGDFRYVKE